MQPGCLRINSTVWEKKRENGEKTVRGLCAVEVAGSSGRFM